MVLAYRCERCGLLAEIPADKGKIPCDPLTCSVCGGEAVMVTTAMNVDEQGPLVTFDEDEESATQLIGGIQGSAPPAGSEGSPTLPLPGLAQGPQRIEGFERWEAPTKPFEPPQEARRTTGPVRRKTTAEISGAGWKGRAWDSNYIHNALVASGDEISQETAGLPEDATLTPVPRSDPSPTLLEGDPAAPVSSVSGPRPRPPSRPMSRAIGSETDPVGSRQRPASRRITATPPLEELHDSLLYRQRTRSRFWMWFVLGILVLAAGALAGFLVLSAMRSVPGRSTGSGDPATPMQQTAERRARTYGLEPILVDSPFEVSHEIVQVEYPRLLALALTVTNRGPESYGVVNLDVSWHQIHDVPQVVRTQVSSFGRPVSVATPLSRGESVSTSVVLVSDFEPPGQPRESFAWVSITAAGTSDQLFRAAVDMIEVPIP